MANKEPGYVYILTNPSFREDWVKWFQNNKSKIRRNRSMMRANCDMCALF